MVNYILFHKETFEIFNEYPTYLSQTRHTDFCLAELSTVKIKRVIDCMRNPDSERKQKPKKPTLNDTEGRLNALFLRLL